MSVPLLAKKVNKFIQYARQLYLQDHQQHKAASIREPSPRLTIVIMGNRTNTHGATRL
jgi:hypothetical protein